MSTFYYAGIGSRNTPEDQLQLMVRLAQHLASHEFVLRSGGAPGADTAFEYGCDLEGGEKQIFIPWNGFNNRHEIFDEGIFANVDEAALTLAQEFHPNWDACGPGARRLHARNCYQVLGPNLITPSEFILCWTAGGLGRGGTGQTIRIARSRNIPVFDLGSVNVLSELDEYLQSHS